MSQSTPSEKPQEFNQRAHASQSGWFERLAPEPVEAEHKRDPTGRVLSSRDELQDLIWGDLNREQLQRIRRILRTPLFVRRETTDSERSGRRSLQRAKFLARHWDWNVRELLDDPSPLFVLHEWLGLSDGVACTILSTHYCLAIGTILARGGGREELAPVLAGLEKMDAVGVFLATELGYGNYVSSLETRADYDSGQRCFFLTSPTARSNKFLPNTACAVPKIAVLMARLVADGREYGVFPFIVRIRNATGRLCDGVRLVPLSERPGYPLDNGMIRFEKVRIPESHVLTGTLPSFRHCASNPLGTQNSKVFLGAMDPVQIARIGFSGSAVAFLRAASFIAYRRASLGSSEGHTKTRPLLDSLPMQRDVFGAMSAALGMTFGLRRMQRFFASRTKETEKEVFSRIATFKVVATEESGRWLFCLHQRCGAVGLLGTHRLSEYLMHVQGMVSAEGDQQAVFAETAKTLCFDLPRVTSSFRAWGPSQVPLHPTLCTRLLHFRAARLAQELASELRDGESRSEGPSTTHDNARLELIRAYGHFLIADAFRQALLETRHHMNRRSLQLSSSLFGLGIIERNVSWFVSNRCLTPSTSRQLPVWRDRLCEQFEPHVGTLAEAFGFDDSILQTSSP